MDMDWDFISFFLAALAGAFFLVAGLILGVNALSANSCENKATTMGFKHSYSFTTGCMINVKDQWVPLANYRVL